MGYKRMYYLISIDKRKEYYKSYYQLNKNRYKERYEQNNLKLKETSNNVVDEYVNDRL